MQYVYVITRDILLFAFQRKILDGSLGFAAGVSIIL